MSDRAFLALEAAFGTTVHGWPSPAPAKPRWWQRKAVRHEARINAVLTSLGYRPLDDKMRDEFWRHAWFGQAVDEDAGGYCWRCWAAALGVPYRVPELMTYSGRMVTP